MKKVGIITFHQAHNYGAFLQVYALQNQVEKLGYNVQIINYRNKNIAKPYKLIKFSKNPFKFMKNIYESIKFYKKNKKRIRIFNEYINKELKLTRKFKNLKELKKKCNDLNCYITGSDQVWNYEIVGELSDAYTLNFGDENVNRISYAASIGNSKIEDKYKKQFKDKLNIINYISVREEDAKRELEKIINKPIEVVLDPTLLLTKDDWDNIINERNSCKEKYILAYVVKQNEEYNKIVNYLSEQTGLKVVHFERENSYKNELKSAYTEGPFEFVNLIKNAEYIITTSFHATVFSILYHKKFFVIPHINTGSRIINLLNKVNLNDRILYKFDDFKKINFNTKSNYKLVDDKLEEERKKSIKFLKEALKN